MYTQYHYINVHGDVVVLTNESGNKTKSYSYNAFGVEYNEATLDDNPFRYCGEYYDKETKTIYLRARYYNPAQGRFTQQDGWAYANPNDPLSLNLYIYCWNNPLMYVDINGQQPVWAQRISKWVKSTFLYKCFHKVTSQGWFAVLFDIAGFTRDKNTGIYHAKQDCWQQYFGYNHLYDTAFDLATDMAVKRTEFTFNGQDFVIWMWKGDYLNLGAGAEVGIYYGNDPHWLAATEYAMPMTLTLLDKTGEEIFHYTPEDDQWWITGFDPNCQNAKAQDLTVLATIDFSENKELWEDFCQTDPQTKGWNLDTENYIASIRW